MFIQPFDIVLFLISTVATLLFILSRLYVRKLKKYHSSILGDVEVWQKSDGERYLTINKSVQGISIEKPSVKKSYWYFIARHVLDYCKKIKKPRILFLGLGANTSSLIIFRENPSIHQTIIEIDDSIIDACKTYFKLDELQNYQIVKGDIHKLINTHPEFAHTFDCVVIDIFSGDPPFVSLETNEPQFIHKLMGWAKKDALFIFNRHADTPQAQKIADSLQNYLKKHLSNVTKTFIKDPRGYKNYVILAKTPSSKAP